MDVCRRSSKSWHFNSSSRAPARALLRSCLRACSLASLFATSLLFASSSFASSFASLLIVSYPIYETLRSFVRRTIDKNTNFLIADDRHLHSVIFRFVTALNISSKSNSNKLWMQNASAGMSCWLLPLISSILAVFFQSNMPVLLICVLLIILFYELSYRMLNKS